MVASGALGTGLALAAPLSASAASTVPTSYASGQFLAGSIAGENLARLAAVEAATASNNGSEGTQVTRDPLGVGVLGGQLINDPAGVQLNLGKIINLGAAQQYAQAENNGSSMASSGAVNNDGGVGVGTVDASTDGNADVDLNGLLGSKFAGVISDLDLQAQAVSAQATGALTSANGEYTLAGLTLNLQSPAIANLTSKVTQSLGPIDAQLAALDGPNGQLAGAVNNVVTGINPLLTIAGANANVNASVNVDLASALAPLLTGQYGNDGVSFNLQTGAVSVDLAKLLGGQINNEPVGTEVLSDKVVNQVLNGITTTIDTLVNQILAKVKDALANAAVNVNATLNTSTAQAPQVTQNCVSGGTGTGLTGTLGNLLGATASTGLSGLVCTPQTTLLPNLDTSLALNIDGTVDQLVNGTAPAATANATVLGVPVALNLDNLTKAVAIPLTNLLTGTGGEAGLAGELNTNLVDPAVTGLLGSGSSVEDALTKVLSVTLNNQSTATGTDGNTFTETALKVSALPDGTNSLATVDLANATVGPNATTIATTPPTCTGTSCSTSCTTGTSCSTPCTTGTSCTTTCTTDCSTSSGQPNGPLADTAADGNLAFTGVGIAGLVAAILALLAAGAYLVREGYRRNGRRQIP